MAKYSTGGMSGGGSGACELCGAEVDVLQDATIAGAQLSVCKSCAPHDDRGPASQKQQSGGEGDRPSAGRRAAQQAAKFADAAGGDSRHWEEHGTNYEKDQLPYLVSGYGDIVESARQEAGLTIEELADELDIPLDSLEAVEQGRAARAGVGGSVIETIEEELDLSITERA